MGTWHVRNRGNRQKIITYSLTVWANGTWVNGASCSLGTVNHLTLRECGGGMVRNYWIFICLYLMSVKIGGECRHIFLLQMKFRRWQQGSHQVILFLCGGFVPGKPFIFSDGEVLREQAWACFYCVINCSLLL